MATRSVLIQARQRCRISFGLSASMRPFMGFNCDCYSARSIDNVPKTSTHHPLSIRKKQFSSGSVFIPKVLCENRNVAPYVRTCLSGTLDSSEEHVQDTGFHVWFLGTGGSLPTKHRMTSATMLQLGGQSFLFDAGEGLQRQLMFSRQCLSDISKIFITHMHADHVLGLPGMLLMAHLAVRDRGWKHTVEVYGPPGIYNFIAETLSMTFSVIGDLRIVVYELVGGGKRTGTKSRPIQQRGRLSNAFRHKSVVREEIPRNDDGTWTIQTAKMPTREDAYDVDRGGNRPMNIAAAEVTHLETIQTFGYVVSEPDPNQKIDADKAADLGVAPSKKYRQLKNGFSVMSDDGIREVRPEQVLIGANRKVRKLAYIGDNCGLTPAMTELCMHADLVVHEAVMSVVTAEDARRKGHSSAAMAGEVARRVDAHVLALNHFSAGLSPMEVRKLVSKAEETNGGVSCIVPSFDFMELIVPRFGFRR